MSKFELGQLLTIADQALARIQTEHAMWSRITGQHDDLAFGLPDLPFVTLREPTSSDTISLWLESRHTVWLEANLKNQTALAQWWSVKDLPDIEDCMVELAFGNYEVSRGDLLLRTRRRTVKMKFA